MKNLTAAAVALLIGVSATETDNKTIAVPADTAAIEEVSSKRPIDELIKAMIQVESGGNDSAYAASENAAGCLQIRPICVREVNRVLRIQKINKEYTLDDRWSRNKSIEMFLVLYHYRYQKSSHEKIARCWNGGPNGHKKIETKLYWKKVKKHLDN